MTSLQFDAYSDRQTLLGFKDTFKVWRGNPLHKWGSPEPLGNWQGVRINEEGRVIYFFICGNFLRTGRIFPELGNLTALVDVSVTSNRLTGDITSEVSLLLGNLLIRLSCL